MKKTRNFTVFFCNAVFLFYGLHYFFPVNKFILGILINLLIFIVPGLAWIGILKDKIKNSIMLLFFIVFFSLAILTAGLIGHYVLKIEPRSITFLAYLIAVTNTGLFLLRGSVTIGFLVGEKKEFIMLTVFCLLIYGCLYYGARKIPLLPDFDIEMPGTSYGLLHELKPYQTNDVSPVYFYFPHPPLTNLYTAYGILFFDKVDDYKFYYDSAKQAEKIMRSSPGSEFFISLPDERGVYKNIRVLNKDNHTFILAERSLSREAVFSYLAEYDRKIFPRKNLLLEGRTANLFVSIIIVWSLFKLVAYLTGCRYLGFLSAALYIFSPGIFVRSVSVDHTAVTIYGFVILACQYIVFGEEELTAGRNNLLMFLPGVFAAWANQKVLIIVAAIFLLNAMRRKARAIINAPVIGYIAGMALFWIYGLTVDKYAFFILHIREHFFDRILHIRQVCSGYPSFLRVWKEFQIECPVFILGFIAMAYQWKKYIWKKEAIFIFWFLLGAIAFSVVDWKQSKHLMTLAPALIGFLAVVIPTEEKWHRAGWLSFLAAALFYCLLLDLLLLNNFAFYAPTADW